ncbi:MAG: ABC transporter permease [Synergistaceae bacterium]|jgi:putative ABC transport system permease protein|nr:ABC transporter permease [Synergistaceae bacterium]
MFELFRTAISSLWANKTRSILTMLGIVIGVGAVIAMVAIGNGAGEEMADVISGMGVNMIMIFPGTPNSGGARMSAGSGARLTLSDIRAIEDECWSIQAVAPQITTGSQIIFENRNWASSVTGTTPGFFSIREYQAERGRLLDDEDERNAAKVAVLGSTLVRELFSGVDPIGKSIRIRNIPFEVVGTLAAKGQSAMGPDQDDTVVIPITTAQRRLTRSSFADSINMAFVQAKDVSMLESAMSEITGLLRQRHRLAPDAENDFSLGNMTDVINSLSQSTRVMTLLLGSVASISLIVGGIGIMNIMLVSVTERTREIGIRMAIGASAFDIRVQFLLEAMLLSLVGGIIGILLGYGASVVVAQLLEWPAPISGGSIALAAGFSCFIGVFFGFYPAWKASSLRPIDALRFE